MRALSTEIKTPCCEKQPSRHVGCAACRLPGVILLLCAVPETHGNSLCLVWGTEHQGKRWSDWVDLTWGRLPWRRLPGGAVMGFKREICSLYSWCKKLKFNQVEKQNSKAGRIWEDSLRGHGVCLTAFSKRQVMSVRFMESFGALFPMDYSGSSSRAECWPFCEGKAPLAALAVLWTPDKCSRSLGSSRRMLQSWDKLRWGRMCSIYLYPYLCTVSVQTVVLKGFIKSPCLFAPAVAHIQGCHGESVPMCWGLYLHLWFLWGSPFVLRTCHGWDWCYEAVGGSSPCRKCQEEMQTGVNHIPAQNMVCSLSDMGQFVFLLLLPPLPLCWHHFRHHMMFTGPHSDSSQWNELNITIKENCYFAEDFFWLKCGSPLEPTHSCTKPSGFFEQGEEWMEWESLENAWTFTCARKACLATAQRLPHPEQMAQIQLLWNLWTSDVPQRLCVPCRCSICQVASM